MIALAEPLTPTEASVVARVPLRDVNRAVDERILPTELVITGPARRLPALGCPLIAFYFGAASRLTAEERLRMIGIAATRLRGAASRGSWASLVNQEFLIRDEFLTVDLAPFLRATHDRLGRLEAARAAVVEDPEILGGEPVIAGTRVPVHDVAAALAAGQSAERIQAAYLSLDRARIELAGIYAAANPPRGRPRRRPEPGRGMVRLSRRRVSRRGAAG